MKSEASIAVIQVERPAEPGSGEAAWSRNRRAEFDTSSTR